LDRANLRAQRGASGYYIALRNPRDHVGITDPPNFEAGGSFLDEKIEYLRTVATEPVQVRIKRAPGPWFRIQ